MSKNAALTPEVFRRLERLQQRLAEAGRKPKPDPEPVAGKDRGPSRRYQHGDATRLVPTERAGGRAVRIETQTMLDRYRRRRQIDERQYDAGNRLYRQWRAAGRQHTLVGSYGVRIACGRREEMSEHQAHMARRYGAALEAVGRQLAPVLVAVCLCDEPARRWATACGKAPQSGIVVLQLALDALADHYGL